jgi:L-threonylcarbamoyladenylate synthase
MSYSSKRLDEQVIKLLKDGGVGFMPSDTIYGLSGRALHEQAVGRIYRLKQRDYDKPLIVLIATISQLNELNIDIRQTKTVDKYWPGQLTLICDAPKTHAWLHRGTNTLAVRLTGHKTLRELIEKVGPIVSTSTNIQGGTPAGSVDEAQAYFGDKLDFYVDAGDLSGHQPSTLVRSVNGKLEVIRDGAVKIN